MAIWGDGVPKSRTLGLAPRSHRDTDSNLGERSPPGGPDTWDHKEQRKQENQSETERENV